MSVLSTVKNITSGGDPTKIVQSEMQRNPQFAQFVKEHQNMTVNDLMNQYGIDPTILQMLLK